MATITLAELRLLSRQRADMEKSQFVKDSEINAYINNSVAELYDMLCEAYGSDYFVELAPEGTVVANQSDYDLPTDFYELKAVDLKINGTDWVNVRRFNFNERNRYEVTGNVLGWTNTRYRIVGNVLKFAPIPDPGMLYRIWYVPTAPKLISDSDTLDELNGYSEYVITDVAIKLMQKEESDVSVLAAQKQALIARIRAKSETRDAAQAATISDIHAENNEYYYRRGN